MLSGDTPVIVGPDGPEPRRLRGTGLVVIEADRWKLGQLASGDRVRLVPVDARGGRRQANAERARCWPGAAAVAGPGNTADRQATGRLAVGRLPTAPGHELTVASAGDHHVLRRGGPAAARPDRYGWGSICSRGLCGERPARVSSSWSRACARC